MQKPFPVMWVIFKVYILFLNCVYSLFELIDKSIGTPNLVIYNPSVRIKGSIIDINAEETRSAINITWV